MLEALLALDGDLPSPALGEPDDRTAAVVRVAGPFGPRPGAPTGSDQGGRRAAGQLQVAGELRLGRARRAGRGPRSAWLSVPAEPDRVGHGRAIVLGGEDEVVEAADGPRRPGRFGGDVAPVAEGRPADGRRRVAFRPGWACFSPPTEARRTGCGQAGSSSDVLPAAGKTISTSRSNGRAFQREKRFCSRQPGLAHGRPSEETPGPPPSRADQAATAVAAAMAGSSAAATRSPHRGQDHLAGRRGPRAGPRRGRARCAAGRTPW